MPRAGGHIVIPKDSTIRAPYFEKLVGSKQNAMNVWILGISIVVSELDDETWLCIIPFKMSKTS